MMLTKNYNSILVFKNCFLESEVLYRISARDCKVSEWGSWGTCTATCGQDAVKERVREVKVKPKFEGMDCPSLMERTSCNLSACMDNVKVLCLKSCVMYDYYL